jgi:hypothetical protein
MTECLIERGPDEEVEPTPPPVTEAVTETPSEPSTWDRVGSALAHRVRTGVDRWRRF